MLRSLEVVAGKHKKEESANLGLCLSSANSGGPRGRISSRNPDT